MTRWHAITILLALVACAPLAAMAAIFDWSGGALGSAIVVVAVIVMLARTNAKDYPPNLR